jgi:hypothetical protein
VTIDEILSGEARLGRDLRATLRNDGDAPAAETRGARAAAKDQPTDVEGDHGGRIMTVLTGIFSDPAFSEFRRNCFRGEVAEQKIGVLLATQNPTYLNFAMNALEFTRLIKADLDRRVDEAWVVFAHVDGQKRTFKGQRNAAELREQIRSMGLEPRSGRYGPFYVLPAALAPGSDDEPF